jgi:UDP-N-acetylmuramate--alanine ligase
MLRQKKLHFVGIGGAGMSGLAHMCLAEGYQVTGSDLRSSLNTSRLQDLGAVIHYPHSSKNVPEDTVLVVSSAIPESNEELGVAKALGLPIKKRAEVLGWFMQDRDGIAVAGCHGKTTTTTMVSSILTVAGLDPSTVVGGEASHVGGNAKFGSGQYLVAEADESDGSFLFLPSKYSIITNIDNDHLDYYGSFRAVLRAFSQFIENTSSLVVLCGNDPNLKEFRQKYPKKIVDYGFSVDSDYVVRNVVQEKLRTSFEICLKCGTWIRVLLKIPGQHNVLNAAGAIALCDQLGIQKEYLKLGLENFQGVQRRFELISDDKDILIYDDYAHHPTEVRSTLAAARAMMQTRSGKLVVCFQPHRYSRLNALSSEFRDCFQECDFLYLLPVYGAGETPISGVSTRNLYHDLLMDRSRVHVFDEGSLESYSSAIRAELVPGDVLLTMGAGDVTRLGRCMGSSSLVV